MEEQKPIINKNPQNIAPNNSSDVYDIQNCLSPGFWWTNLKIKWQSSRLQKDRIDIMHHYEQYRVKKEAADEKILFTKSQMETCRKSAIRAKKQGNKREAIISTREYVMRKNLLGILENNSATIATIWLKMDTMFSLRSIAIDLQQTLAILKKMTGSFNASDLEKATDGLATQSDLVKEMEDACNELNTVNFDYDLSEDSLETELESIMSGEIDEEIDKMEKNIKNVEIGDRDNNNGKEEEEKPLLKPKAKPYDQKLAEFENWGTKKTSLNGIQELI